MKKIFLINDYLGRFGSKQYDFPYRSGMDKQKLIQYFNDEGYEAKFIPFFKVQEMKNELIGKPVLYTSQEDVGYYYKNYIEDIIYDLESIGAKVIPPFKYLRANNNKVYMEILRKNLELPNVQDLKTMYFGTLEELLEIIDNLDYPVVLKGAAGAMSRNVVLAKNKKDLLKKIKKISRTRSVKAELKEFIRKLKYNGYKKESKFRNKFIVQNLIPGMTNDWKIVIFADKYYVLFRGTRKNDFRASGSGNFIFKESLPAGLLDFAKSIFNKLNLPMLSIDVGFDGKKFILFEFQAVYFGTTTIEKSPFYFVNQKNSWEIVYTKSDLEKEYVASICKFLESDKNY